MPVIKRLTALEILDSRGRPTVKATCELSDGPCAAASVPSGASTGRAEAFELRDVGDDRYDGLGCRRAVAHVNFDLNDALARREFANQEGLDRAMIELDGTADKSRLGANAILAVSIAFARCIAKANRIPLYRHFAQMTGTEPRLPRLAVNLFSGGKHAGGQVPIQDVLVVPTAAQTIDESLATTYAVYQAAARLTSKLYRARPLVADEGGLAPPFEDSETMLKVANDAIRLISSDRVVAIAIDVASTHFYHDGKYHLGGEALASRQMVERVALWVDRYPIVSVEDGLAEDDWEHWPALRQALAGRAVTMGDDLLCTNPSRIRRAVQTGAADALLLKVNQIGTLTEAAESCRIARDAGWAVTVSARSGETEDDWLADLAVGWAGDSIKIGSITRSERLAKYNRLLAIEAETGLPMAPVARSKQATAT